MIPRYDTKEMSEMWSLENQYRSWEIVELAVCHAWAKDGVIPADAMKKIDERSGFDADEVQRIEAEVHHDMIAFDTSMANHVGPEGRYIHLGLTSSDVEDTASAMRLRDSLGIIISELKIFMQDAPDQAVNYTYPPFVGPSHGVHAEPITFVLNILNWY